MESANPMNSRLSAQPFLSVVLPIYNEERHIQCCLEGIARQTYPHELFEILLVDGGSTDRTLEMVEQFSIKYPDIICRVQHNPKQIVPAALNIGIKQARGSIIVRVDGHTVLTPDYMEHCVYWLEKTGAANVGGAITPVGVDPLSNAIAAVMTHPFGAGDAKFHYSDKAQFVDTVYMGAFQREIFDTAGLFDEHLVRNQDYEMNYRIRKVGGRIFYSPDIRSHYTPRSTLHSLARQYFQYGWWKVETLKKHPESIRWRQAVPPAFVAAALSGIPFLFRSGSYLSTFSRLLWITYVTGLSIASYGILQANNTHIHSTLLPLVFVTIHFSWGLGFWCNLLSGGKWPRFIRV
jgi:glycosyltransferase involved in cell wall biosynthesis